MHELAITEEILRIAVEHAEQAQAKRVTDINLVIGELSSVVDDSVQFYFDFSSPGTIAEGAKLHFTRVPARLRCRQCDHEFEPDGTDWRCPNCQTMGGDVITGREFFLDSIQVE
jgi:hydrogenase nickel incorporation protein HypA/HybF